MKRRTFLSKTAAGVIGTLAFTELVAGATIVLGCDETGNL
jgi:hypothetical protein